MMSTVRLTQQNWEAVYVTTDWLNRRATGGQARPPAFIYIRSLQFGPVGIDRERNSSY